MKIIITLDADWALPEVLEYAVSFFIKWNVVFTFFATEDQIPPETHLCETAWHPNFIDNDPEFELDRLAKRLPGARGLRPHRLDWGKTFNPGLLKQYGIEYLSSSHDADIFIPKIVNGLPDFPITWGDNFWFMYKTKPDASKMINDAPGFYLINFHPIHIYLNTTNMAQYSSAKEGYRDLKHLSKLQNESDFGVRNVLTEFLSMAQKSDMQHLTLLQACEMSKNSDTSARR
jgi:Polysaccharide deacetylase